MRKVFSFFSKKVLIYTGIGLLLVIVVIIRLSDGNGKQTVKAEKMDIIQEVAVTGKVKPNQSVNLGFDKSGRVGSVYALVGEAVKKGQIIATLESGEISADLAKAKASLLEENINLREIKNTAPISYNDARKNLDAAIKEGFADADNAVRNRADQFFKNTPGNPQFEISITSGNFIHYFDVPDDVRIEINNSRRAVEKVLVDWQKRMLDINPANVISEADKAISDLNAITAFLDEMAAAVNTFSSADYAYDTTVSGYKTAISSARSEASGAISSIVTAKDKLNAAPVLGEGGQFDSVLAQEAKVKQAEAAVSSLEASLAKSVIYAPFDGIITLQDAKAGGTVSAGVTLVSVISQNEMYIEANVSEINIGKIEQNDPTSVTFDAFPGEVFSGEVSYIEPGDVIIDGIVNYKIRVNLTDYNSKIKSGLTANLEIQTGKKENAVAVPLYALLKEADKSFVNKIVNGRPQRTPVELGFSGSNGFVEIRSGLEEGDIIEF